MRLKLASILSGMLFAVSPAFATLTVALAPNVPTAPVGSTIAWTATVSGDPDPTPSYEYEFTANLTGAPTLLRRGFSPVNTYSWTSLSAEGAFTVGVTVKNVHDGSYASQTQPYTLTSRLPKGVSAVVNPTKNPLVALFTGEWCSSPNSMIVFFKPTAAVPHGGITALQATSPLPCRATPELPNTTSMNFYVAGMYPTTTYQMYYQVANPSGAVVQAGPILTFTTGAIPSSVSLPVFTASGTTTDQTQPIILHCPKSVPATGKTISAAAVDTAGNVLWYTTNVYPLRTEFGGSYFGVFGGIGNPYYQGIREVDLAGNTIIEMSAGAISEQLEASEQWPINQIHLDVRRIYGPTSAAPNGNVVMLGTSETVSPSAVDCANDPSTLGAQGGTCASPVDILYDQVVVLNSDLGLVWNWDATNYFNLNQAAILGETYTPNPSDPDPPLTAYNFATGATFTVANDWTHSNSVQYTAYDGNFIISAGNQDLVFKINYANGTGDGHVMWELGRTALDDVNGNPLPLMITNALNTVGSYDLGYPWNSHQHDVNMQWGGTVIEGARILTLFDNGNTLVAPGGFDPNGNSRCLLYAINETELWANLNVDSDVGSFSNGSGSSQTLANSDLYCDSGFIGGVATTSTENTITGSATIGYTLAAQEASYRTFRMSTLYTPSTP